MEKGFTSVLTSKYSETGIDHWFYGSEVDGWPKVKILWNRNRSLIQNKDSLEKGLIVELMYKFHVT